MFLLDKLQETFKSEESSKGFDDLNYILGNTSGMDVGQVPSPLDQRIGRMAQIGGKIMEIQITNPATFQIDRPEMTNVISQLELDFTLHGDPNIGFTAAYATGTQVSGYHISHRYFDSYLEQAASYKREFEKKQDIGVIENDIDPLGYINMHASNEMIPPREEQIASDKSLDPFGKRFSEINGDKTPNIYRNKDFMELLFDFLVKEMLERYELYQLYGMFSNESEEFKEKWQKAQNQELNEIFNRETEEDLQNKASVISAAATQDNSPDEYFVEQVRNIDIRSYLPEELSEIDENELEKLLGKIFGSGLRRLPDTLRSLRFENDLIYEAIEDPLKQDLKEILNDIWNQSYERDTCFSIEAKLAGLANTLDYDGQRIRERAASRSIEGKDIGEWAKLAFAGRREMFSDNEWDEKNPPNLTIFEQLIKNTAVSRQIEKESTAFFHTIPAWMQTADREFTNHRGWSSPKFIWKWIVEANMSEEEKAKYDLTNYEDYLEYLDRDRENELDVIAAVGVCYIWGHFTQHESKFSNEAFNTREARKHGIDIPDLKNGDNGRYTWIEWMNKFGVKINLEAMFGDPGQLRRVWRPKDIAIACHAINKTASDMSSNWEEEYSDKLVKFTIDMEHTASYGVDPVKEMDKLAEQEKKVAKELDNVDEDKPLADIVKTYHLTKPGWEQQSGHRHGPFSRGDETLYYWLYRMVADGFARNENDPGIVMFEVGGEYREEMYVMKVAMDMIQQGISPEDLDPNKVPMDGNYETVEQQLMGRFYGIDEGNKSREWAKIEEHAFDPLKGLLEAEEFDYTYSSVAAIQNDMSPREWPNEEYK